MHAHYHPVFCIWHACKTFANGVMNNCPNRLLVNTETLHGFRTARSHWGESQLEAISDCIDQNADRRSHLRSYGRNEVAIFTFLIIDRPILHYYLFFFLPADITRWEAMMSRIEPDPKWRSARHPRAVRAVQDPRSILQLMSTRLATWPIRLSDGWAMCSAKDWADSEASWVAHPPGFRTRNYINSILLAYLPEFIYQEYRNSPNYFT